jgi:hypothetical protein
MVERKSRRIRRGRDCSNRFKLAGEFYAMEGKMDRFEEIGRRIDEELARLRQYLEQEVAPETERRTASFLREAAKKLEEAAAKVEARIAGRRS